MFDSAFQCQLMVVLTNDLPRPFHVIDSSNHTEKQLLVTYREKYIVPYFKRHASVCSKRVCMKTNYYPPFHSCRFEVLSNKAQNG